ncbi:MAG: hypothetical protein NT126_11410 [Bacteroidetes bacterium]|nr:hypothetical protein [Bacteroidota bacterium]
MEERTLTKAEAGYQMLQILSAVDGHFSAEEDIIIRKFLVDYALTDYQMEEETEVISAIEPEDYILYFHKAMDDYYEDSTPEERIRFLDYAVQLVKADNRITKEENIFLNELYDAWAHED